jgi:hypothetical protein
MTGSGGLMGSGAGSPPLDSTVMRGAGKWPGSGGAEAFGKKGCAGGASAGLAVAAGGAPNMAWAARVSGAGGCGLPTTGRSGTGRGASCAPTMPKPTKPAAAHAGTAIQYKRPRIPIPP